jgi:hypothetical protein
MDYITYLRLQKKVGCMGPPRFWNKAFFYNILHVWIHSRIICQKFDNIIAYIRGQNIFPFNLPIEIPKSFIHLWFKKQSPLHTLFEVFLMNSCECTSTVNFMNGVWSHHMNDNIPSALVILKVVTFNKLLSVLCAFSKLGKFSSTTFQI